MVEDEHFYDSLEDDGEQSDRSSEPPNDAIDKLVDATQKINLHSQSNTIIKHAAYDIRSMLPLTKGEICKKEYSPLKSSSSQNLTFRKTLKTQLIEPVNKKKSYMSLLQNRKNLLEKFVTQSLHDTTRAFKGDDSSRTDITNFSAISIASSFDSDTDSLILKVIEEEKLMVPPLNLDRGESCCNFNSISSVDSFAESVTNSTTSSQNIKVLKKISLSKPRKTFKSSTSLSLTSEVTGEVPGWKRRQSYGRLASQRNILKIKEQKLLKELNVH